MYTFYYKRQEKKLPYQDSFFYKVLPHGYNNIVFYLKCKFYDTFWQMSISCHFRLLSEVILSKNNYYH
jgi:hypothetical protein